MIQPNMSERERLVRTILGVYGMLLGFLFIQGVIGFIVGVIGLAALITGVLQWCPLYHLRNKPNDASASEE